MPHRAQHIRDVFARADRIALRPPQQRAREQVVQLLDEGHVSLRMPPNSGRTTVAMAVLESIWGTHPEATALYLCSSWLNAMYAARRLAGVWGGTFQQLARGEGSNSLLHALPEWRGNPRARICLSTYGTARIKTCRRWRWPIPDFVVCDDIELLKEPEREWLATVLGEGHVLQNSHVLSTTGYVLDPHPLAFLAPDVVASEGTLVPPFRVVPLEQETPRDALKSFLTQRNPGRTLILYNHHQRGYRTQEILGYLAAQAPAHHLIVSTADAPDFLREVGVDHIDPADAANYAALQELHGHDHEVLVAIALGMGRSLEAERIGDVLLLGDMTDRWLTACASRALAVTSDLHVDTERRIYTHGFIEHAANLERSIKQQLGNIRLHPNRSAAAQARSRQHEWHSDAQPLQFGNGREHDPALRGLWTHEGMTFGIEFEFTHDRWDGAEIDWDSPSWIQLADALQRGLGSVDSIEVSDMHGQANAGEWRVEYDGSCGWEVVSPILRGRRGFESVVKVCDALRGVVSATGLRVDYTTGLHVHIGWDRNQELFDHVDALVAAYEPALATMVPPSRIRDFDGLTYSDTQANEYAQPVCATDRASTRYRALNFKSFAKHGTVEIRMHSGSFEAQKILLWVSLWQQLLWYVWREHNEPVVRADPRPHALVQPDGDILKLARLVAPDLGAATTMLIRLDRRRREILKRWENACLDHFVRFAHSWEELSDKS